MKKSSPISFILLVSLLLALSACSTAFHRSHLRGYAYSPVHLDPTENQLEKIASNVFRIQTLLKFRMGEATPTVGAIGLATSLDEHHLLTAGHVVKIKSVQMITPVGPIEFQIPEDQKLEEERFVVLDDGTRIRLRIVHLDEERDFALLGTEQEIHHVPFRIGNSDDLKLGNFVYLLGNFQTGLNIRSGYVTQLNFVRYGPNGEVSSINENLFGISAVTVEGDSGAPIFLLRDGRLELGGIVTFLLPQARGLGFGVKINPIMQSIKRYLKEEGKAERTYF